MDDLYQDIVMEHAHSSAFQGTLCGAPSAKMKNPLCGDEIELFVECEKGVISNVRYESRGCAISRAAASMMAQELRGKTLAEARKLSHSFEQLISTDEQTDESGMFLGDLQLLEGVRRYR